ncbi:MAG: cytidylate kinase family protein [Planctomycetes bacterium]|nr:cytidylate kinase family protein [Planctomycetota bacterium]
MTKVSLAGHMKEERPGNGEDVTQAGPFVTISRQFGCYGFSLGLLMMEVLNDDPDSQTQWKIYHREVLERLATETDVATETLDRQRRTKPRLLLDLFRSLSRKRVPSGFEVRRRIRRIIRELAIEGGALIVGQGSTAATSDLPNGLSVRLEAPLEWRVREVAFREGLSETKAKLRIKAKDREREYLRRLYQARSKSRPPFSLTYDCSTFTLAKIAQHVVYAMKLKGCL